MQFQKHTVGQSTKDLRDARAEINLSCGTFSTETEFGPVLLMSDK